MSSPYLRAAFGIFAALFFVAALLQLNDPSAVRWMTIYLIATGVTAAAAAGSPPPRAALVVYGVACLLYAALLTYRIAIGDISAMYGEPQKTPALWQTAEGRELGGLILAMAATGWVYRFRAHLDSGEPNSDTPSPSR